VSSKPAVRGLSAALFAVGLSGALGLVVFPFGGRGLEIAAAVILAVISGGALGLYTYVFQPPSLDRVRRLVMLALLVALAAAGARLFLSIVLSDADRRYLPYLLLFTGQRDNEGRHPFVELALVFLGPIAAMVIQFAVSRQREFEADRVGAEILGRPMPLANALRRLDAMSHRIPMQIAPAVAPLAQVNPLAGQGGISSLFSTHPPTEQRVERLEEMPGTLPGA